MRRYIILVIGIFLIGTGLLAWYAYRQGKAVSDKVSVEQGAETAVVLAPLAPVTGTQISQIPADKSASGSSEPKPEGVIKEGSDKSLEDKVAELKARLKLSDVLLKEFPDVYENLAKLDTDGKLEFLQKIARINDRDGNYNYNGKMTVDDIVALMGEVLSGDSEPLFPQQKLIVINICTGCYRPFPAHEFIHAIIDEDDLMYKPISATAAYIINFLGDKYYGVRKHAVKALGILNAQWTTPQVRQLFKDSNADVRGAVAIALARLQVKDALPELTQLLHDRDIQVQWRALTAVAELKMTDAYPEIIKLVYNQNSISRSALHTLIVIEATGATPLLLTIAQDNTKEVWLRNAAVETLGEMGDHSVVPGLMELLKSTDINIDKDIVIMSLGQLKATEAIPQIAEFLNDRNYLVRVSAGCALVEMGAQQMLDEEMIESLKRELPLRLKGLIQHEIRTGIRAAPHIQRYKARLRAILKQLGVEVEEEKK